jgi:hypothetical protein
MVWVIGKKHRSLWFLSFFVPSLFSFLTLFFPPEHLLEGPAYDFSAILTVFILIGIWLLGLVIILIPKNKSMPVQLPGEIADRAPLAVDSKVEGRSSKESRYKHTYLYIVLASLLITFAVAGYSCFNIYHGYKLFVHEKGYSYGGDDIKYSQFTFECPKNFYELWGGDFILYLGEEVGLSRDKLTLFTVSSSIIIINVTPQMVSWDYLPDSTLVEKCIHYYYRSNYGYPVYYATTIDNLTVAQTNVGGIPAEYASFIVGYPDSDYYYPYDEIKMVCFERERCIWVIRMENIKDKAVSPDPDFEHLVGTFRIID